MIQSALVRWFCEAKANGRFVAGILPKMGTFIEAAILTLEMDILTITMFLDGILMDIMIYNGEIWCKLSALVMVYIHWRTPTFHLDRVFNPPPLTDKDRLNRAFLVQVLP